MSYYDVLMSDSELQRKANQTLAQTDFTPYTSVTTTILQTANEDSQKILAQLQVGDRLKIIHSVCRGQQTIEVFTAAAKLLGVLPQGLVDTLTIKEPADSQSASSFEETRHYRSLSGFAIVRTLSGGKRQRYTCEIDLYYQLQ